MSGIALVFRRDGAPVAVADLQAMTAAMGHRAIDGVHHEIDGPIGVGFCSMSTTPSAQEERQPRRCRNGSTIVAMDGRIDDRRTLLARLGRAATPAHGDSELLAQAVERWGAGFVDHLVGDFAVVAADVEMRRVLVARDHLGVKPIYYAAVGPLFVAASEMRAVLAHPGVPHDLDPAAFDRWVEHRVVPDATIYGSVHPVPMGSILAVTSNGVMGPSRYWTPSCAPSASTTQDDLVEEYRALLTEATADRLRSNGPVVVAMSGGLDSTTVASTALDLARRAPGLGEVRIGSLVYPGHPQADESALIDSMESRLGVPVRRVRPRPRTPAQIADEIDRYADLPDPANDQLAALVQPALGERVLLTGLGGDDWFYASSAQEVAWAVRHGRLATATRAARARATEASFRWFGQTLWQDGVRPLAKVPTSVVGRSAVLSSAATYLGRDWARRALGASRRPSGVPIDSASLLAWSCSPLLSGRFALMDRRAAHHGFELRHPLHDVRLVELSLRLPGRLRSVGGDGRWLPRRAATDLLPDDVRLRREKAEFSLALREELDLLSSSGVIDGPRVEEGAGAQDWTSWAGDDWLEIRAMATDAWHPRLAHVWAVAVLQLWQETTTSRAASSLR